MLDSGLDWTVDFAIGWEGLQTCRHTAFNGPWTALDCGVGHSEGRTVDMLLVLDSGLDCGLGHRVGRTLDILLVLDCGLDWTVDLAIG